MIKELINFTKNLPEDFKSIGIKSRNGLHIMLSLNSTEKTLSVVQYEIYSNKMVEESEFIKKCKFLAHNAWYAGSNKAYDKGIHTCSPFCVAFKKEFLNGGGANVKDKEKNKNNISDRFKNRYFENAFGLLDSVEEKEKYTPFKDFFILKQYENLLCSIEEEFNKQRESLNIEIESLKQTISVESHKHQKEDLKNKLKEFEQMLLNVKQIDESEYYLFYLDEPIENYIKPHNKYLADKLFNIGEYNTDPDSSGQIFGISGFLNSKDFGGKKPFSVHLTSTFDISGRISNIDANCLNEFYQILSSKILPNPLPVFIFKEELQQRSIGLFKESGFKIGYKEILESLIENYKEDLGDYYLLNYINSADGILFRDFDFVSKFEYLFKCDIDDLFQINYQITLRTIFEFQNEILPIIFNNNLIVKKSDGTFLLKYFDEIDASYCKSNLNQILILKYRKSIYDFVYKSRRNSITQTLFNDVMRTSILEDIRLDKYNNNSHTEYFNIRKKLNIWFSLYEKFSQINKNEKSMASKLKEYQEYLGDIILDKVDLNDATDEQFMFVAGQVIEYILSKSRSADQSYQLLEPYTQKSNCKEFQKAIANDFARYKHANYSGNFEKAASFVLTYETDQNLKNFLPQLLAGLFSKNQLFHLKKQS